MFSYGFGLRFKICFLKYIVWCVSEVFRIACRVVLFVDRKVEFVKESRGVF